MADPEDDAEDDGAPAATQVANASPAPTAGSAAAPASPDFTSMVRPPGDMAPLQGKLAEIQRAKTAAHSAIADETTARLDSDRARMESAYKASATVPDELKSGWDTKAKTAEHSTDPVTAFGSIGSVFAMLASSFAGVPMEQALNAGAAAINAVHTGDEKAYQKEYEAWKANTDLAIKRHDIQRQAYNDATTLMNSNINAGRTKMELAATKFGDVKAQALLDAGLDKELFDLIDSRNTAALKMQDQWDKVQLQHEKVQDLRTDPRYTSDDHTQKAAAVQEWSQRWAANGSQKLRYDAEADYIAAQKRSNANWTPDDLLKWKKDFATAEEGDASTSGPTSSGKIKAAAIKELFDNAAAEGKPITLTEATKQYNMQVATPTGNRIDDISKQINMFDNGKNAIDRVLAAIDKHWRVGAVGYASRGAERLGNVIGSDTTDASQVAHDIQYLQTIAPRLMNDASSRGLKAEADKIGAIIAGLNFGDTTANTKRALGDVRDLWDKMQQDNIARRNGAPNIPGQTGEPGGPSPPAGARGASGAKKAPWLNDPVVKPAGGGPRAEAEEQPAYG